MVLQLCLACAPVDGKWNFGTWAMDVIAVPIIFGFFVFWKVFKSTKEGGWVRLAEMDLVTGRKDNWAKAHAEEQAERASWGSWQRIVHYFC